MGNLLDTISGRKDLKERIDRAHAARKIAEDEALQERQRREFAEMVKATEQKRVQLLEEEIANEQKRRKFLEEEAAHEWKMKEIARERIANDQKRRKVLEEVAVEEAANERRKKEFAEANEQKWRKFLEEEAVKETAFAENLRKLYQEREEHDAEQRMRVITKERIRIYEGSFYSTVGELWEYQENQFTKFDLDCIRRPKPHCFYLESIEAAEGDLVPVDEDEESESEAGSFLCIDSTSPEKYTIDGQVIKVAEEAHLIPHSGKCAHFYAPLVEAAVGVNVEDDTSLRPADKRLKRLALLHGAYEDRPGKPPGRVSNTGVRHCFTNIVRVVAAKYYFDFKPSLLIVPVLTLEKTLAYDGGLFDVLVACTCPKVYMGTMLTGKYGLCAVDEVKTATDTLVSFVKAAAYTLQLADRAEITERLTSLCKASILSTKDRLESTFCVKVPLIRNTRSATMKPAKISIKDCDPFLLFVKAAVVWSSIQDQKILPGGSPPHDCENCLQEGLFQCLCHAFDP